MRRTVITIFVYNLPNPLQKVIIRLFGCFSHLFLGIYLHYCGCKLHRIIDPYKPGRKLCWESSREITPNYFGLDEIDYMVHQGIATSIRPEDFEAKWNLGQQFKEYSKLVMLAFYVILLLVLLVKKFGFKLVALLFPTMPTGVCILLEQHAQHAQQHKQQHARQGNQPQHHDNPLYMVDKMCLNALNSVDLAVH